MTSTYTRPLPRPTALSKPFWDACNEGKLLVQRCQDCKKLLFIPRFVCDNCMGDKLEWIESSGKGSVYSYTTVWRPQTPAFEVPYVVAIIDIQDGYQMLSNVVGCEPDEVYVGMPVQVKFEQATDEITLPRFVPAT